MILVKEIMLFSNTGVSSVLMDLPDGAYITHAFMMNGAVFISYLCDDSRPMKNRYFHMAGPFANFIIPPGKKFWHVGTVDYLPNCAGAIPLRYYIVESEK